jgi:putative hydrolase of the HAD superfamily
MNHSSIIFDFFGVICSEVAPFWLAKYLTKPDAETIKRTLVDAADRGQLSQRELFVGLASLAKSTPERVEREWLEYVHIDSTVVALIRDLGHIYKVGLLSNAPSQFIRGILEREGLRPLFDSIVISSEIGCAKPDRQIYEQMIRDLAVNAREAIMVDDNPVNVAGANAVGITGVLYHSCEELRAMLLRS